MGAVSGLSLMFPKTAKEVRHMMDYVNYHKMWVPSQVCHLFPKTRSETNDGLC